MPNLGPYTPLNMDYLHDLANRGYTVIDIMGVGLLPTVHRITAFCSDGSEHQYTFDTPTSEFMDHYLQAMAFSGYGPRALGNFIHADICRRMNADGLKYQNFQVGLSPDCKRQLGDHLTHWTHYGYTFHELPSLQGVQFVIKSIQEAKPEKTDGL